MGGHVRVCHIPSKIKDAKHRAYHSWQLVFRNPVDFTWNPPDFMWKHYIAFPTALHKTEEFFLKYLIYKFCRWISHEICMKSSKFHMKSAQNPHEIQQISDEICWIWPEICQISCRISWMWAFGWSPSIGLSFRKTKQAVLSKPLSTHCDVLEPIRLTKGSTTTHLSRRKASS